jgi:hypothetical protein
VINSKAIFDVLKKIASRSSEIRRSDPLPKLHNLQLMKKNNIISGSVNAA